MSRAHLPNKDTGSSTFYNTHHSHYTDTLPFASKRRLVTSNAEAVESLGMEVEGKLEKLKERVALHEHKVERNYL